MQKIIKLNNINFTYNNKINIFENLSLEIENGEFITVLGSRNSGKSTLAKLLAGTLLPRSGEVFINGLDLKDKMNIWNIRRQVGVIFQNPHNQIIGMNVEEEIAFGLSNIGCSKKETENKVSECLQIVGLGEQRNQAINTLSGGQKQKLAIASVLALETKCIIFDEATTMLDPLDREHIFDIIKTLNLEKKITIINITRDVEQILNTSRIIALDEGSIFFDGDYLEFINNAKNIIKKGISVPLPLNLLNEIEMQFDSNEIQDFRKVVLGVLNANISK